MSCVDDCLAFSSKKKCSEPELAALGVSFQRIAFLFHLKIHFLNSSLQLNITIHNSSDYLTAGSTATEHVFSCVAGESNNLSSDFWGPFVQFHNVLKNKNNQTNLLFGHMVYDVKQHQTEPSSRGDNKQRPISSAAIKRSFILPTCSARPRSLPLTDVIGTWIA